MTHDDFLKKGTRIYLGLASLNPNLLGQFCVKQQSCLSSQIYSYCTKV